MCVCTLPNGIFFAFLLASFFYLCLHLFCFLLLFTVPYILCVISIPVIPLSCIILGLSLCDVIQHFTLFAVKASSNCMQKVFLLRFILTYFCNVLRNYDLKNSYAAASSRLLLDVIYIWVSGIHKMHVNLYVLKTTDHLTHKKHKHSNRALNTTN